jgi:hypothetical protein
VRIVVEEFSSVCVGSVVAATATDDTDTPSIPTKFGDASSSDAPSIPTKFGGTSTFEARVCMVMRTTRSWRRATGYAGRVTSHVYDP